MINAYIKATICILVIFSATIATATEPSINNLIIIKPGERLDAEFTQQRHLSGLDTALKSHGQIQIWGGAGLVWHTAKPFKNTLIISKSGMFRIDANNLKTEIATAHMPKDNKVFELLSGILGGSFTQGLQDFTVETVAAPTTELTQVKLIPKHLQMQKFIASIDITGNQFISKIVVRRTNSDYDEIILDKHTITKDSNMRWLYD